VPKAEYLIQKGTDYGFTTNNKFYQIIGKKYSADISTPCVFWITGEPGEISTILYINL